MTTGRISLWEKEFTCALSKLLSLYLVVSLYTTSSIIVQVSASFGGLGDKALLNEDTSDWSNEQQLDRDFLFGEKSLEGTTTMTDTEKSYVNVISLVDIDVVSPGKELRDVMSMIATKSMALFLMDHDQYFNQLKLDTISRPMLRTLFGIKMLPASQLMDWYQPIRDHKQEKVISSCRSLITKRKRAIDREELMDSDYAKTVEECNLKASTRLRCPYLTFKSNINLFMLDTYIALCRMVEGKHLSDDLRDIKTTV